MKIRRSSKRLADSRTGRGSLRTIEAKIEGKPYEFASFAGGPWEVYDHPRSHGGIPRFCGYLPKDKGEKLSALERKFMTDRQVSLPDEYDVEDLQSTKPKRGRKTKLSKTK